MPLREKALVEWVSQLPFKASLHAHEKLLAASPVVDFSEEVGCQFGAFVASASKESHVQLSGSICVNTDELSLLYQPIEDRRGVARFHEKLLRVCSGSPVEYLDFACTLGFLPEIDSWVVGNAKPGDSVNLTATNLENLDLVDVPDSLSGVMVEITEQTRVQNLDEARKNAHVLKARGATLALDDMGEGHNTERMLSLPVDYLKVEIGPRFEHMVHAAKAVGCKVVAEKIETESDFERARQNKVDLFQGYLLGRPKENRAA